MKKIILLTFLLLSINMSFAANFVLTVQNQMVVGNSVTFDLYIRTTAPADTIFLASSSWGWTYNLSSFTSPSFSVVDGYTSNFTSRTGADVALEYVLTANVPVGNIITGDISGPDPSSQTLFNQRVARITNQASYHRIGRYMLTGLNNPTDPVNLAWFIPYCAIWQYQTTAPFNTEQVTGTYEIVAPLPAPTLSAPANNSVNLSLIPVMQWNAVSGAANYKIQISTDPGFATTVLDSTVTGTSINVPSGKLVNNTVYFWRVNASNPGTTSPWSAVWNFRTILATPTLTSPPNGATNQTLTPLMTWSAVSGAANYGIQISTNAGFSSFVLDTVIASNSLTVASGKLNPGVTYYWRVNSQNFYGTSLWSSTWNFSTYAALTAPNLVSPANGTTCLILTPVMDWSDVSGAANYRLQLSTSAGFGTIVLDTVITSSQAAVAAGKLTYNTIYYWRVLASNSFTSSPWSATWNFESIIAVPVLNSPVNGATNQMLTPTLQYNGTTGITSYRVQVASDGAFSSIILDSSLAATSLLIPSGKLNAGTTYYWRVNATRNSCITAWSAPWNFSTMSLPSAPILAAPVNGASNQSLTPTMQWNAVSGAINYTINISTNSGFSTLIYNTTVSGTSIVLPNGLLTNGTTYYWRVYATNAVGNGPWSAVWNFSTFANLAAPILSSPLNGASNVSLTPTMQWNAVSGAASYNLQISANSGFTTTVIDVNIGSNSYTVSAGILANNTQYFWRVNAANAYTTSPWSSAWNFTTFAQLSAPLLTSPANGSICASLSQSIDWNDVSGASSYRIQISTNSAFGTTALDTVVASSQLTVPAGKLSNWTTYYWRVNAANAYTTSPWSSVWNFETVLITPVLSSPANGSSNISLTPALQWGDVAGAIYYNIEISTDLGFSNTILDTTINTFTLVIPSGKLNAGTTYYWRVHAIRNTCITSWSSVWSFNTLAIPGAPTLIAPVNGAANQVLTPTMQWSSVPSSTGYRIQISASSLFGTMVFDTTFNGTSVVVPSGRLSNGTAYYWRVYAQNNSGPGPWSAVWNFSTFSALTAPVLTLPANGSNNISVTPLTDWNDVSGATGYRIQISTDAAFGTTILDTNISTSQLTVAAGKLTNNTLYYWRVNASNSYTVSPWSAIWNFRTILAAPILSLPANGAANVSLTPAMQWGAVTGATSYRIQISTDGAFGTTVVDSIITTNSMTVPGGKLIAGTAYYWRVNASNTYGTSAYSGVWNFTTLNLPGAPVLIAPANGAANVVLTPVMQWNAVSGSISYRIQISASSGFGTNVLDTTIPGTSVVVAAGKLNTGTTYYWRVYANNTGGNGPWSAVWSFSTYNALSAPVLTAPANGAANISVTPLHDWNDVTDAVSYRIMISTDPAFGTSAVDTTISASQYSVPAGKLSNNTLYYWRVMATNSFTSSPWSAVWNYRTILTTPILSLPANGATNVSLTPSMQWGAVTGATSYRIQISTDVAFGSTVVDSLITTNSMTVPGGKLIAGTSYYWRVNASNTYGTSAYSTVWNFTTLNLPGAPVLVAPANGSTNIVLTPVMQWNVVSGSISYRIQISTSNAFGTTVLDSTVTGTTITVPAGRLSEGMTYYWRVYANNAGGNGPWSAVWSFSTYAALVAPVLSAPANGSNNVSVTPLTDWNDISGAASYRIQISTDVSFGTTVLDTNVSVSQLTVASGKLSNNTLYYWRVNASNSFTTSPWSSVWNFRTILASPILSVPSNGATNVVLTPVMQWNAVTGATSYRIQISSNISFTTTVLDSSITGITMTVPSGRLSPSTTYYWRVNASNTFGTSAYSAVWNFSTAGVPQAPVLVSPLNNTVNQPLSFTFIWNSVPGLDPLSPEANTYEIQASADSLNFTNPVINAAGLSGTNYTVGAGILTNFTKYFWRVRANNGSITGPWSAVWNFRTILSTPVLTSPVNGAINVPQAPLLNWNDVTGATSYQVQVSASSGFGTTVINQSGLTISQYQVLANVLNLNTLYYWRVKAFAGTDTSVFSGAFNFTTEGKITVNMTIIPGGFYNTTTGKLNMKDTLRAYLIDTVGGAHREDSAKGIIDSVNFTVQFMFDNAQSGSYYLYVYHRNHLPVSSAARLTLSRTAPTSYNFTDLAAKAFGSNMIQVSTSPVRWGIIPGDANRDEFVDGLDQTIWIQQNGFDGYLQADFNGDIFVDGLDQSIWILNNGSSSVLPYYVLILSDNEQRKVKLERLKNNNNINK